MRCYFLKNGHIAFVMHLTETKDAESIAEARQLFERNGKGRGAEGFEVWDDSRLVYCYPDDPNLTKRRK